MTILTPKQEKWLNLITECKDSGMTVTDYCQMHNVSDKTYYYYNRKFKLMFEKQAEQHSMQIRPQFEELKLPAQRNSENIGVRLTVGKVNVEINENISDEFILRLVRILNNA